MSRIFEAGLDPAERVALRRCVEYEPEAVEACLRDMLESLGISDMFTGKKVVVKPNLVMKKAPEAAATTHPVLLGAMLRILCESAESVTIAESPGGPYTEALLRATYKGCGIQEAADACGVVCNLDTSFREEILPEGKTSKIMNLITPILEADVIVNLCKLKSHSLTGYSGAVKNYFGTVPGVQKFETHARFPDYGDFGSMLCDLASHLVSGKPTFNLIDGILAMEGNGPTGGSPRKVGCLIGSRNPFNADRIGSAIIGADGVVMLEEGTRRGFCPPSAGEVSLDSPEPLDAFVIPDFEKPDTVSGGSRSVFKILPKLFGGRLYAWLQPRPVIDGAKCVGCGECVRSCPRSVITLEKSGNSRKKAIISPDNCIKCYCCQELCPYRAVRIKKNPLLKLLGG